MSFKQLAEKETKRKAPTKLIKKGRHCGNLGNPKKYMKAKGNLRTVAKKAGK